MPEDEYVCSGIGRIIVPITRIPLNPAELSDSVKARLHRALLVGETPPG